LRTLFPQLTVTEIVAGLPGTGSNLGACRLERDVLRHRPDLLFVEFAVNDTGSPPERIERSMEGIVR
jgi:lysophospholipase L1-like esterase